MLVGKRNASLFVYMVDLSDGLPSGSETNSSAVKDLQSKLDAVNTECLAEKEKVFI